MEEDVRFRIETAAKILERAASRTSDPKLKEQLLHWSQVLRETARSGNINSFDQLRANIERQITVDDVLKEIRDFIWKDKITKLVEEREKKDPLLRPFEELEEKINAIILGFEQKIQEIVDLIERFSI